MNDIVKATAGNYVAAPNPMVPKTMNDALRLAEFMCKANSLPEHLRGSPGDCLLVIEQAMRWNMSPFAVAQCTSVIHGKLMYEGKLVAAAIEESGAIIGLIDYKFKGEGENRTVIVSALRKGETEPREVEVTWKNVKTAKNDQWNKDPDQMLCYSGVRVWGRRWTPGVMLGVYSDEEVETTRPERAHFDGETVESTSEHVTTKIIYTIQTPDELKTFSTIAAWKESWQKAVSYLVKKNLVDELVASRQRNEPFFTEIAAAEPEAVLAVRNMIANALGEPPADREPGSEG